MTGEEGGRKGEKTETGFSEEEGRSETDGVVAAVAGGRRRERRRTKTKKKDGGRSVKRSEEEEKNENEGEGVFDLVFIGWVIDNLQPKLDIVYSFNSKTI